MIIINYTLQKKVKVKHKIKKRLILIYKSFGLTFIKFSLFLIFYFLSLGGYLDFITEINVIAFGGFQFHAVFSVNPEVVLKNVKTKLQLLQQHVPHLNGCKQMATDLNMPKTTFQKDCEIENKKNNINVPFHSFDIAISDNSINFIEKGRIKPLDTPLNIKKGIIPQPFSEIAKLGYNPTIKKYKYQSAQEKANTESVLEKAEFNNQIKKKASENSNKFFDKRFIDIDMHKQNDAYVTGSESHATNLIAFGKKMYEKNSYVLPFSYGQTLGILYTDEGLSKQQSFDMQKELIYFVNYTQQAKSISTKHKDDTINDIKIIIELHKKFPETKFSSKNTESGENLIKDLRTLNESLYHCPGEYTDKLIIGTAKVLNPIIKEEGEDKFTYLEKSNALSNVSSKSYKKVSDYVNNNKSIRAFLGDT